MTTIKEIMQIGVGMPDRERSRVSLMTYLVFRLPTRPTEPWPIRGSGVCRKLKSFLRAHKDSAPNHQFEADALAKLLIEKGVITW